MAPKKRRVGGKQANSTLDCLTEQHGEETFEKRISELVKKIRANRNLLGTMEAVIDTKLKGSEEASGSAGPEMLQRGIAKIDDIPGFLEGETVADFFGKDLSFSAKQAKEAVTVTYRWLSGGDGEHKLPRRRMVKTATDSSGESL